MKYLKFVFLLSAISLFQACEKDDDMGGSGGGGSGVDNTPMQLSRADFAADLILTDRNDGVDYIVTENIDVNNDLEIRPGVVIEFEEGTGIDVRDAGTINAVGLADEPIIFTGKIKSKGAWIGIIVESQSLKNQFKYCEFSYAGSETWGNGITGALTTWSEVSLNIDHCTFRDNAEYGVQLYSSRDVDLRSFENNTFENNDKAVGLHPANAHQLGRDNTYVGNNPMIDIYDGNPFRFEESNQAHTWKSHPIPYHILGAIPFSSNSISIEAGADFVFAENAYFDAKDGASFTAIGTPADPITMNGENGGSLSWPGLSFQFSQSNQNVLEYVEIDNAGNGQSDFEQGAIYMWASPKLRVENCTFRNINSCIFHHATSGDNDNLTQQNNQYINTGAEICN